MSARRARAGLIFHAWRGALACVALLGAVGLVQAQPYPAKPIRMVVGFPAGGPADIVARILAPKLAESLGQPVIVDNRGGAGGAIATEQVARSAADGYTVLLGTIGGLAVAQSLVPNLGYDTLRDLAPVTQVVSLTSIVVIAASSPARTMQELIEAARAAPRKLTYASSGNGTAPNLSGELFKSLAGVDLLHVPYKGSAAALTALLRGEVDINFENSLIVLPHIKSGKLRALAVTSAKRSPLLPELPTISEAGVPGYAASGWYGLMAPVATPNEIVARLHAETIKVLRLPEVAERLASQGAEPVGSTPAEFTAFIRAEIDKWGKLVRSTGMKAD